MVPWIVVIGVKAVDHFRLHRLHDDEVPGILGAHGIDAIAPFLSGWRVASDLANVQPGINKPVSKPMVQQVAIGVQLDDSLGKGIADDPDAAWKILVQQRFIEPT